MRDRFIQSLTSLFETRDDVILITADLGFGIFNDIRARFADRFVNVGVAEQNMMGVASGLGLEGWTVFAYSIGNFATLRNLEQVRNDAAYHNLNVNIVASGGGFTYGALGMSHHATEDLSILRVLPGVEVVVPCDAYESQMATLQLADRPGVGYLRIEKDVPYDTQEIGGSFTVGKWRVAKKGSDITCFASGSILNEALVAAEKLEGVGISMEVISAHTLSPGNAQCIHQSIDKHAKIITLEENTIAGGLGGYVAEVVAEYGKAISFCRIGMQERYSTVVGEQNFLRTHYNLDAKSVEHKVLEMFK